MIMYAVILGFPAVLLLIVGAIKLVQSYREIRDAFAFMGGGKRSGWPDL